MQIGSQPQYIKKQDLEEQFHYINSEQLHESTLQLHDFVYANLFYLEDASIMLYPQCPRDSIP